MLMYKVKYLQRIRFISQMYVNNKKQILLFANSGIIKNNA